MDWLKRHRLKLAASLVSMCAFYWLLEMAQLPWLPQDDALAATQWWALPLYIAVWAVVHVVRALRWQLLLSPLADVPLTKVLAVSFVGFAAIVMLPLRTGGVVRPALIREEGRLSGWSAIGTVGAERVLDGLFLAVMLWLGLLLTPQLSPLPDTIGELNVSPRIVAGTAYGALALFGGALVAMAAFYFARSWARGAVAATVGRVSTGLSEWLSVRVEKVANGLAFLPRASNTLAFVALTAVYWIINAYATCWLADGVGMPELGLGQACVVTGVLALGVMVPNAPGFLGAFQFSVFAALSLFYPPADLFSRGASLVFLLFLGQTIVTLVGGIVGAVMLRTSLSKLLATSETEFEG
jgi:uncharacterized membrane protein YbhN (UPF0104 family)